MEYRNKEILESVENEASKILKENFKNKYRDHFFPMIIDAVGYETAVEVGSNVGEYAEHLLSKSKIKKLYCIDTWQNNFGSDGYCDSDGDKRMNECSERLKEYISNGRCELVRMSSLDAIKVVTDDIDFIYIDGDHSLGGILFDLYAWTPKVRVGGMISGHDYKDGPQSGINDYWGKQLDYAVKTSFDYFTRRFGFKLNVIGGLMRSAYFVRI